jgi:FKBP-type peptidyl-prolyl cis-trans isomerase
MARKRERAFALFGAILFLVTSSALTIAIIYSAVQNHNTKQNDSLALAKAQAALKANATNANNNNKSGAKVDNTTTGKLEGTPLSGWTPTPSIPTLQEQDLTPGTGDEVKSGATVTVDYTGAVAATGTIFQSSKDTGQTVSFPLANVIAGWTQGVPGMKVGGTRRLLIPASLAYGANPPQGSGIPANADLVFDITLHAIK